MCEARITELERKVATLIEAFRLGANAQLNDVGAMDGMLARIERIEAFLRDLHRLLNSHFSP